MLSDDVTTFKHRVSDKPTRHCIVSLTKESSFAFTGGGAADGKALVATWRQRT